MNFFDNHALPEHLQKALQRMKFETPTPIQEACIPIALKGKDLIGCAQTGTGKTAAFAIPLVTQSILDPNKSVLVLAPTRELAAQIRDVIFDLSQCTNRVRTALIVGGASMSRQLQTLRQRPPILIATPGRLMDHLRRKSINLSKTTTVVLDEADRMLDMGFGPQIEEIFKFLPKERQTLLFSATLPPKIRKLAETFLNEPEHIAVGPIDRPASKVEQSFVKVEGVEKSHLLLKELQSRSLKTLIFTRTKRGADKLSKFLDKNGIDSACIHGDRTQSQRERAISDFRSGRQMIMVATDVASRGLDVDQIHLVINFDLPETAEDYIHRIGRTGRAGHDGLAMSFVRPEEFSHWKYLQNPNKPGQKPQSRSRRPARNQSRARPQARGPMQRSKSRGPRSDHRSYKIAAGYGGR